MPSSQMICKYCNKESEYKPIKRLEEVKAKIYWCESCFSETIHWQRNNRITRSIYVTVNGRMFRWSTTDDVTDFASLWRVGKPGIPGQSINENVKCIATFGPDADIIPNINPQNIKDKLSKYLIFL